MFGRFKKPDFVATLQEQGGEVVADARSAATEAVHHAGDLLELFRLELREYSQRQARRMAALLAGAVLLLVSYLLLSAALCALLARWLDWPWAVGCVFLVNLVVGLLLLLCGAKMNPGPMAPATRQELRNDLQCLKLAIEQKRKS